MKISEVMTSNLTHVDAGETLANAARKMGEADVGSLPVVDAGKFVGVATDRGIVVRGLAGGQGAQAKASGAMTADVVVVADDATVEDAAAPMSAKQIRRLYVTHDGALRGVVSLGDLALTAPSAESGAALRKTSKD